MILPNVSDPKEVFCVTRAAASQETAQRLHTLLTDLESGLGMDTDVAVARYRCLAGKEAACEGPTVLVELGTGDAGVDPPTVVPLWLSFRPWQATDEKLVESSSSETWRRYDVNVASRPHTGQLVD